MPRKCFCGMDILSTGTCENTCSRWAEPGHLRAQARKRQERDAYGRRQERFDITAEELRRIRRAVKKFDKVYAYQARRGRMAALKRHAGGMG